MNECRRGKRESGMTARAQETSGYSDRGLFTDPNKPIIDYGIHCFLANSRSESKNAFNSGQNSAAFLSRGGDDFVEEPAW
jgi:hypothetical protein